MAFLGDIINLATSWSAHTSNAASDTPHTNDAATPNQTLRLYNDSPIESQRTSASTVDHTPPACAGKRPAPTDFKSTASTLPATKRSRVSQDEQRLVRGKYGIPADATPVPSPYSYMGGSTMKKPGAEHSLKPVNTINEVNYRNGHKPKTYGTKPTQRATLPGLDFLESEPVPRNSHKISAHDNSFPAKRRKVEHARPPSRSEIVDLEEVDELMEVRSPARGHVPHWTPPQRSAPSLSQRSSGNRYIIAGDSRYPPSGEFATTSTFINPHRKKARSSATQRTPSRMSLDVVENGAAKSSPITIGDDSPKSKSGSNFARQLQFGQFKQGVDSTSRQSPEVVSKHFQPASKINPSTFPPRGDPKDERHTDARTSPNLRNQFRRAPEDTISEDELAPAKTKVLKRSKSPSKPQPTAKTGVREKDPELPLGGWALSFARAHDCEERGPGLALTFAAGIHEFRVVGPDKDRTRRTKFEFALAKVNEASADDMSRIRLKGSRTADGLLFQVDLEFLNRRDFLIFRNHYVQPKTKANKIFTKEQDYMVTLFNKPFDANHRILQPTSVVPASEQPEHRPPSAAAREERPARTLRATDELRNYAPGAQNTSKPRSIPDAFTMRTEPGSERASARSTRSTRQTRPVYVEAEEEPSSKSVFKFSVENGLGKTWDRQLQYGSGRRRAVVDFSDLERLDEEEFLNDQLVDFYLLYLFNEMKVPTDKVYIFNTHFFPTLTRKVPGQKGSINYPAVARWTSREDLFSYDYIVVPINEHLHWYLAIICNVSNISRKLFIEDIDQNSTPPPQAANEKAREPSVEQMVRQDDSKAVEKQLPVASPTLSRPTVDVSKDDDDINLFDEEEESKLNLVDVDGPAPEADQGELTAGIEIRESPAAETARMQRLSITESSPRGIFPTIASSLSTGKKIKRKTGPPAKKWDPDEPVVIILDSIGSTRSPAVRALKDYIREEGKAKRGMEANITQNAYYAKSNQVPLQNNWTDCGVYLLGYTQKFFQDPDDFKCRLLSGEMQTENDWPDMTMPQMRDTMRNILFELYAKQEAERKQSKAGKKSKKSTPADEAAGVPARKSRGLMPKEISTDPKPATAAPSPKPEPNLATEVAEELRPSVEVSTAPPAVRLGSPFQIQPSPQFQSRSWSPMQGHVKVHGSPAPPEEVRQPSPRVIIPAKSQSPKRRHEQESRRKAPHENIEDIEVQSPKKQKTALQSNVDSPRGTPRQLHSPLTNGHSPLSTRRSPRQPVSDITRRFKPKDKAPSPAKDTLELVRGSSQDPITIDDSQDIEVSPPKAFKLGQPPARLQGIDMEVQSPRRFRANSSTRQHQDRQPSVEETERPKIQHSPQMNRSKGAQHFVGDPSMSHLRVAQQMAERDDEFEFDGFSDDAPQEESTTVDDDTVVPESPAARRVSPGPQWDGEILPL